MVQKRRKLAFTAFTLISPIKHLWGEADCRVHIDITRAALEILRSSGYADAYEWYAGEFDALSRGLVWADAGFKSASHFFFPYGERKGLRGQHDGLYLTHTYYHNAQLLACAGQKRIATFYLGAALHIIQDASVPQHATLRLMDSHRAFEKFVRKQYPLADRPERSSPVLFDELDEFVRFNARIALKAHRHFASMEDQTERFLHVMKCVVPVAERVSAGALVWFYTTLLDKKKES